MTGKDMTDSGSEGAKQRWMCMVDHNGGPCPGHPNFPDKKSAANNTERCDICALPLEGTMIGNGDGSGQRFAHPECYYRQRCVEIEKRNSEMTERVKELEIEREAARNEIQYLNGICDSEIGQKEKMQSQLDAANKRNEELERELESSNAGKSLLRRELNDVCLNVANDKRESGYQVAALTRQLDKQDMLINQGCPHGCTDGNCPYDRRFKERPE